MSNTLSNKDLEDFKKEADKLCTNRELPNLMPSKVQTNMGRRGARWAYQKKRYVGLNSEGNRFITNDDL